MDLSSILFLVLVFFALVAIIVFMVKGFNSLGVVHVIIFSLLFLCSVIFVFLSAVVHQRRVSSIQKYDKIEKRNVVLVEEQSQIKYGDLTNPIPDPSTLLPVIGELGRVNLDRGRVWRNATPQSYADGVATVVLAPPETSVADQNLPGQPPSNTPPAPDTLAKDLVVYAFGDGASDVDMNNTQQPMTVAKFFLGEFYVTESNGQTSNLRPTIKLTASQTQALDSNQYPRWSIYEVMPVDSHTAYAQPDSKPTREEIFGRMDPLTISKLINIPLELLDRAPSTLSPAESNDAITLRSYLLDGQRAPDGTPNENIWWRIEFLQEFTEQVDSIEIRNASEGGYFDSSGRTVDARLKRAKPDDAGNKEASIVTFRPGDEAVFAFIEGDRLVKEGKAKLIEPIFVRQLNDYAFLFKQLQLRINRMGQDIELTQREINRTKATNTLGRQQIVNKQSERQKLDDEIVKVKQEVAIATSDSAELQNQVTQIKQQLSQLFKTNQELYRRIVKRQQSIAASVN